MKILIRKKGKYADRTPKYILEKWDNEKITETRTLFKPEQLWEMLSPNKSPEKASCFPNELIEKPNRKFAQDLLNAPEKQEKKRTISEEEIKLLHELTK